MTLTEFLLARIAEDEAEGPWHANWCGTVTADEWPCDCTGPARLLGEAKAKRRIMERCGDVGALVPSEHLARGVLALLALPYSDHPDYRDEWKP